MKVKTNVKAGQVTVENVLTIDVVDDSSDVGIGNAGVGVGSIELS
jgi:hypothetical protein